MLEPPPPTGIQERDVHDDAKCSKTGSSGMRRSLKNKSGGVGWAGFACVGESQAAQLQFNPSGRPAEDKTTNARRR